MPRGSACQAIRAGGGGHAGIDAAADALVWLDSGDLDGLRRALVTASAARWIQLPMAGVERMADSGLLDPGRTWTSAKGAYAEPVAEHALALAVAGLRWLRRRISARSWGEPAGQSLYDEPVTILGGGGIAASLLELLVPFRVAATVVRRRADPVPGAARTLPQARLHEALAGAGVVFLAHRAHAGHRGDHRFRRAWPPCGRTPGWSTWLADGTSNTSALVAALRDGGIGGAALDVTDPEPLPDGHPLWSLENCIITPHTADTPEMIEPAAGPAYPGQCGQVRGRPGADWAG